MIVQRRPGAAQAIWGSAGRLPLPDDAVDAAMTIPQGDYAPQIAADDVERFPPLDALLVWLGGGSVETVEVPVDCTDLFLGALWARPELVLADEIRALRGWTLHRSGQRSPG
jgi:hypothetical protein